MTFSVKHVIILVVLILAILFLTLILRQNTPVPPPIQPKPSDTVSIQSEIPVTPIIEITKVHSPDGKMRLFMEKEIGSESSTYTFLVSDEAETDKKNVFTKTLPLDSSMQIPPNAWSPDNKYFFIKEGRDESEEYLVFRADGAAFPDGEQYINVRPLFIAKNNGHILSDVTGWDSETLLHVFSTKSDGEKGPSFWFEVPSKAIIQLASR